MVHLAREHPVLAGPAESLLARVRGVRQLPAHRGERALLRADLDDPPRAAQFDREGPGRTGLRRGSEALQVHGRRVPDRRRDGLHQGFGAAAVDQGAGRRPGERGQVRQAHLVLGMDRDPVPVGREVVQEGHRVEGAAPVQEGPVGARRRGRAEHRQDRGDADAARDERVRRGREQLEAVARRPQFQLRTLDEPGVRLAGAAAAVLDQPDRDPVAALVRRVAAQRVLADQARGQGDVHVRARCPRGQLGGFQEQFQHVLRRLRTGDDQRAQRAARGVARDRYLQGRQRPQRGGADAAVQGPPGRPGRTRDRSCRRDGEGAPHARTPPFAPGEEAR